MSEWIVPIIVALVAAVPGIAALIQGRRKQNADAATVFEGLAARSGARWTELLDRVDALEIRVRELSAENGKIKDENIELKAENEALRAEVEGLRAEVTELRAALAARRRS